ncbi:MAG: YitT family protein [Candidatus Dactylopiibacterium sp.]|nr:YitT family protein [Candidatus Dactylopiibacterium sp.]
MTAAAHHPHRIPHSLIEDVIALVLGTLMVSFGASLLKQAGALTGGIAGLAFLAHYATGVKFGVAFFVLNLPFYWLAFRRMGRAFVIKTFCAIGLVSVLTELHGHFIGISQLQPFYAAVIANTMMGLGFIVLFRHKASLGGVNILALYLQDRYGIRAGKVQMGVDVLIVLASLMIVSLPMLLASIGGAVILNLIIAMNHRPHRYLA